MHESTSQCADGFVKSGPSSDRPNRGQARSPNSSQHCSLPETCFPECSQQAKKCSCSSKPSASTFRRYRWIYMDDISEIRVFYWYPDCLTGDCSKKHGNSGKQQISVELVWISSNAYTDISSFATKAMPFHGRNRFPRGSHPQKKEQNRLPRLGRLPRQLRTCQALLFLKKIVVGSCLISIHLWQPLFSGVVPRGVQVKGMENAWAEVHEGVHSLAIDDPPGTWTIIPKIRIKGIWWHQHQPPPNGGIEKVGLHYCFLRVFHFNRLPSHRLSTSVKPPRSLI